MFHISETDIYYYYYYLITVRTKPNYLETGLSLSNSWTKSWLCFLIKTTTSTTKTTTRTTITETTTRETKTRTTLHSYRNDHSFSIGIECHSLLILDIICVARTEPGLSLSLTNLSNGIPVTYTCLSGIKSSFCEDCQSELFICLRIYICKLYSSQL